MTTPQSILNNIEYKLKCLLEEFHQCKENDEGEENYISLIDSIQSTMNDVEIIKKDIGMLNNTMSLILKVLDK